MPPLIRRSTPPFPGTPARTAATQALAPTRRLDMAPPRHGARPVTATIGNRTRSGGRSDAHPLPPRQVPGSLAGAAASTVFMLAPSVHGPLAELPISQWAVPGSGPGW